MSESVQIRRGAATFRGTNLAQVAEWARQGRIDPSDFILDPAIGSWVPASDHPEISAAFATIAPSAAAVKEPNFFTTKLGRACIFLGVVAAGGGIWLQREINAKQATHDNAFLEEQAKKPERDRQAALDLKADWDTNRDAIRSKVETLTRAGNADEAMKLVRKYGAIAGSAIEPMATAARRLKREQDLATGESNRREYARLIRTRFLDGGLDIKVSVEGKRAEILRMKFILFNDVWSHRFETNGQAETAKIMGFHRLEMTDGYRWDASWSFVP